MISFFARDYRLSNLGYFQGMDESVVKNMSLSGMDYLRYARQAPEEIAIKNAVAVSAELRAMCREGLCLRVKSSISRHRHGTPLLKILETRWQEHSRRANMGKAAVKYSRAYD
jgi:hypothetical protein